MHCWRCLQPSFPVCLQDSLTLTELSRWIFEVTSDSHFACLVQHYTAPHRGTHTHTHTCTFFQGLLTDAQLSLKESLCCDSYIQLFVASWHFSLPQFGSCLLLQCCNVSSQDGRGSYFCLVFWQHLQRKHHLSHYPTEPDWLGRVDYREWLAGTSNFIFGKTKF